MSRKATGEAEARRRREAWAYAKRRCGLAHAEVARIVGKSVNTVKGYGTPSGNVPTWDVCAALQGYNLVKALELVEEKFGPEAVTRFRQEAGR